MAGINPISWQRFERFLLKKGCRFIRQAASHRIYWREGVLRPLVVPKRKELPVFIIRNNLRLLDVSVEEYLELIESC